ncbi:SDR family oxidoreductase [Streptomyces sp. NPDC057438]|uniref:SDR family oxidoreductase n=1 Tax=Streptomyces sp. NPDC057438 TaxID=3346133 RepID=UPI0036CB44AA
MNAVVHRGARAHETEIRVDEAPAPAKKRGGRGVSTVAPGRVATGKTEALRTDPRRDRAIPGRIPAGRRSRADDLAGATVPLASTAPDGVNGIVPPVDGGRPGR